MIQGYDLSHSVDLRSLFWEVKIPLGSYAAGAMCTHIGNNRETEKYLFSRHDNCVRHFPFISRVLGQQQSDSFSGTSLKFITRFYQCKLQPSSLTRTYRYITCLPCFLSFMNISMYFIPTSN